MSKPKPKMEVTDYYLSVHYGICAGPIDGISKITVDKKVAWEGWVSDHSSFRVSNRNLFGGNKKEGGVDGVAEYMPGRPDQVLSGSLAGRMGLTPSTAPAYRGISSIFFSGGGGVGPGGGFFGGLFGGGGGSGFYWRSNSPYLPGTWITARRTPKVLDQTIAMIGPDANPSHMLYELFTNDDWGMGAHPSSIDYDSFMKAARTLYDEGLGISLLWTQSDTIEKFGTTIINHCEGVVFHNPATGLLTFKLIRDDYNRDELFQINPDNANLSRFQRKLWGETANEVIVSWTNPDNEETETVTLQDIGNIAMQGGVVSSPKDYKGVRNADLAMKLCNRDLRAESMPLASCEATVDRNAWDVTPGNCVKVFWPRHGMNDVIMRVGNVDYGRTSDSAVKVQLVEDVFSLPQASYTSPNGSEWVDPSENPRPLAHTMLSTANYYVTKAFDTTGVAPEYPDVSTMILGTQIGSDTSEFEVVYRGADASGTIGWQESNDINLTVMATIDADLPFEAITQVAVKDPMIGQGFDIGSIAVLGTTDQNMEMCIITAVNDNILTLKRGVLDTVPKEWPRNTPIWLLSMESPIIETEPREGGQTMTYRLKPRTSRGLLDVAAAPDEVVKLTERPWLPHRPANVKINTIANGTIDVTDGRAVTVTWANRNRVMEDAVVLGWTDGNVVPEDGQTTMITIANAQGTIVNRVRNLSGTTAIVAKEDFRGLPEAIVSVLAERDNLESIQGHSFKVLLSQQEPAHRYWRLFFPDGARITNYVQLTDVNFWQDFLTLTDLKLATSESDGTAIASSIDDPAYSAQMAFDSVSSTSWSSDSSLPDAKGQWIGFHFNVPVRVATASARTVSHGAGREYAMGVLQWSDDGEQWNDAATSPWRTGATAGSVAGGGIYGLIRNDAKLPASDGQPHKFWRYRTYARLMSYIQAKRIKFMLAGTEVSVGGTATASSVYSTAGQYLAANAFLDNSNYWRTVSGANRTDWIQYEFPEPTRVDQVQFTAQTGTDDGGDYIFIDYSDDGLLWHCAKFHCVRPAATHTIDIT